MLPSEEPWGWKQIVGRVWFEIGDDRALLIAAGVTYYLLLATAPSLAVIVSIYGLFTDVATVTRQVDLLVGVLPPGGIEIISEQLKRLTSASQAQLSLTLVISLVIAFWSAGAGIRALIDAMNVAYDVTERRPFIRLNLIALGLTLAALLVAVAFVAVIVVMPALLHLFALDRGAAWLIRLIVYGLALLLLLVGLDVLYRWGPYREEHRYRWFTPGAVLAVAGITVVAVAFTWYAVNFSNYNATYGSLGALIGFLTWIWLSVTVIVVGAELNAVLEHHARTLLLEEMDPNSS